MVGRVDPLGKGTTVEPGSRNTAFSSRQSASPRAREGVFRVLRVGRRMVKRAKRAMAERDRTTQAATPEELAASTALKVTVLMGVLMGLLTVGCTKTISLLAADKALLRAGIPADAGLVFGRIRLEGGVRPVLDKSRALVEFRNERTGERLVHTLGADGDFYLLLRRGDYALTAIWSGFSGVEAKAGSESVGFSVPSGRALYLGTLLIRLPSAGDAGGADLIDEYASATRRLAARYPALRVEDPPLKWLIHPTSRAATPARTAAPPSGTVVPIQIVNNLILVPATLNRTQAATLLLDTGATRSLITPASARRLGISPPPDSPRRTGNRGRRCKNNLRSCLPGPHCGSS